MNLDLYALRQSLQDAKEEEIVSTKNVNPYLLNEAHLCWPAQPAAGPRSAAAPPGSVHSAAHRSGTSAGPCPPLSPHLHTAP